MIVAPKKQGENEITEKINLKAPQEAVLRNEVAKLRCFLSSSIAVIDTDVNFRASPRAAAPDHAHALTRIHPLPLRHHIQKMRAGNLPTEIG